MTRMLVVPSPTLSPLSTAVPLTADGPFPFTVAVWQECATCEGYGLLDTGGDPGYDTVTCSACEGCGGAVVATVEVTGPSHHGSPNCALHPCGRGDLDGWHTPTSTVTRLDVPIPMERPERPDYSHGDTSSVPASWWSDIDMEVPA